MDNHPLGVAGVRGALPPQNAQAAPIHGDNHMPPNYDIVMVNTYNEITYQYKCIYVVGVDGVVDSSGWRDTESNAMSAINSERFFVALIRRVAL